MEKKRNILLRAEYILLVMALVAMLCAFSQLSDSGSGQTYGISLLSEGWYRLVDGERVEVTLPDTIRSEDGLILYNDSLTAEDAGKVIAAKGAEYGLTIAAGGEVLYQETDVASNRTGFRRNSQMKTKLNCDARLPADYEGQTLELRFESGENGVYNLREVWIGDGLLIGLWHVASSWYSIAMVFVLLFLAILSLLVSFYLKRVGLPDPRFIHVSAFLITCSIWLMTDSTLVQSYVPHIQFISILSFYSFMLLSIPMLHFVQDTGSLREEKSLSVCVGLFYLNAILQGICFIAGIFEWADMLFVTHVLLAAGVLLCIFLLRKEVKKEDKKEIRLILAAFSILGISGLLAIILYWLLRISFYGILFEVGILLFVLMLLSGLIAAMVENARFRVEAGVYRRLAKEDKLTGLGNRRAFDECVEKVQRHADSYEDVMLIFMDLNRLKYVNDHYGHSSGDEMIISAAQCIRNVFGKAGECFRIGGDEFCVILINPPKDMDKLFANFEEEVRQVHLRSRYGLSVAAGMSRLRDEDGRVKRISDWKYQADQQMYNDKGRKLDEQL